MSTARPIQDFTQVKTIYRTNIRTIQLKICHAYLASPALELQTAGTPYDVYQVLQAIYSTLDDDQEHLVILKAVESGPDALWRLPPIITRVSGSAIGQTPDSAA